MISMSSQAGSAVGMTEHINAPLEPPQSKIVCCDLSLLLATIHFRPSLVSFERFSIRTLLHTDCLAGTGCTAEALIHALAVHETYCAKVKAKLTYALLGHHFTIAYN
jgi:hypothetical protein